MTITIKLKVVFLAFLGGFLAAALAISGLYAIGVIGSNLREVVDEDIPLTEFITNITSHQIEQEVALERAIRFAGLNQTGVDAAEEFKKSKDLFLKKAGDVGDEIKKAEKLIEETNSKATDDATQKEFAELKVMLAKIQKEHGDFDATADTIFTDFEKGEIPAAEQSVGQVEIDVNESEAAVTGLLNKVQGFTDDSAKESEEAEERLYHLIVVISSVGLLSLCALAFLLMRSIIVPLNRLQANMGEIADGQLDTPVVQSKNKDEIFKMGLALEIFRKKSLEARMLQERQKQMEIEAAEQRKADMNKIADDFQSQVMGVINAVSSAATEMQSSAQNLSAIAEETSKQVVSVSSATEQAAANVQTVASASEELSASIREINLQISGTTTQTQDASAEAQKTNEIVGELQETANEIGAIIKIIQDIAGQTNLLALNATIEAARAGEQGKGFAVVAAEVKNLANETGKATEEIKEKIERIQNMANSSAKAVETINKMVIGITESTSAIASAAEEQGAATGEISRNIQEAATGTQEVTDNISGVSQASLETGRMASDVFTASSELNKQADILRSEVTSFISGIRAA